MAEQNVTEKAGEIISRVKRRAGLETPAAADDDGRVGIMRGALRAFAEGDMDGFLDAMSEDVKWEAPTGSCFPGAGEFEGRDEVKRRFIDSIGRTYTSFGFVPESFLDADEEDSVVALGRFVGEGVEKSGVDVAAVQLWEFKGNTAARICIFADSHPFPTLITESAEREREEKQSEGDEGGDAARDEERSDESRGERREAEERSEAAAGGEQERSEERSGDQRGEQPSAGNGQGEQRSGDGERSRDESEASQSAEAG